ncbi:hypothetical protein [Paenibacillus harenae]|uniref:hypothetical protein n=1 Tax=Paenibacillus harenae TaxID=306543 RepID=UPI0027949F36|nr:hypothetical protein [Paenibacillus harenae]MDQ0060031.1 hypothetical protein [Paenibacillus harenae]
MGYNIRGFILPKLESFLSNENYQSIPYANLNNSYILVPLTDELYDQVNMYQGIAEPGYTYLTDKLFDFGTQLSIFVKSVAAYIEADYFGGHGNQSAIVWCNGKKIYEETEAKESINKAIRTMGTIKEHGKDEFETIGLNKYRRLEDWVESF